MQFALRYRTFIAEMRAEGIVLDDGEAAWFFKHKLGLSEVQKQMLETTLGAESEVYSVRERESVRLFKRTSHALSFLIIGCLYVLEYIQKTFFSTSRW